MSEVERVLNGRYRLKEQLGSGGMGAVYLAHDARLRDLKVAVKIQIDISTRVPGVASTIGGSGQTDAAQFEQEAVALAQLKHPGLPKVTDHFTSEQGEHCLVMEFVEGRDLDTVVHEDGAIPGDRLYEYAEQLCDILIYLHGQQPPVIHRDIKPANIRLTPEGRVVLVDFGIAKSGMAGVTLTGARAVSTGYSPLEQYGGAMGTDARSDVYSLGATLYALATGQMPPTATERAAGKTMMLATASGVPLPLELRVVIDKAMALRPGDRFQAAVEMQGALREARGGQVPGLEHGSGGGEKEVPVVPPKPVPPRPRPQWLVPAGLAALVAIVAVAVLALWDKPVPVPPVPPDTTKVTIVQPDTGASAAAGQGAAVERDSLASVLREKARQDSVATTLNDAKAVAGGNFKSAIWGKLLKYEGERRSGRPSGFGSGLYDDGTRYDGKWSEGRPSGYGVVIPDAVEQDTHPDAMERVRRALNPDPKVVWEGRFVEGQPTCGIINMRYEGVTFTVAFVELPGGKPSGTPTFSLSVTIEGYPSSGVNGTARIDWKGDAGIGNIFGVAINADGQRSLGHLVGFWNLTGYGAQFSQGGTLVSQGLWEAGALKTPLGDPSGPLYPAVAAVVARAQEVADRSWGLRGDAQMCAQFGREAAAKAQQIVDSDSDK